MDPHAKNEKEKRESVTVVDAPFLGPSGGFKEGKMKKPQIKLQLLHFSFLPL